MKRKVMLTLMSIVAVIALIMPPPIVPVVQARECSEDVEDACIRMGLDAYSNCRSFGNSYNDCTTLQNRIMWDCFRVNNCRNA